MTMIITIIVVVLIAIWTVSIYNKLISMRMKVREGYSTIDVFLKKRYDLIPNLVETVKGYAKHESQTLNRVVEARGNAISGGSIDKSKLEGELSNALSKLLMISESYPELKADSQFISLQNKLKEIESEIEKARRYYNGSVRELNTCVQKVPDCFVASIFNIKEEKFFEIENSSEKENIEIKF